MNKSVKRRRSKRIGKSLSARLIQTGDRDNRISRDVYDRIGQDLAAIKMSVKALITSPNSREQKRLASEAEEMLGAAIAEVTTASHFVEPPMLDELGLAAALQWYIDGYTKLSGIHVEAEIPQDLPRFSNHVEIALFRIVQEYLINLHQHTGSSRACMSISATATRLRLEVKDETSGDAVQNARERMRNRVRPGVDIPRMRERLRMLGGSLEVRSSAQQRRVVATLPIPPRNR